MTRFFRLLIKAYSYVLSPLLGSNCRYYPTCSSYAKEAFKRHGALKGLILSIMRISRCHPWSSHPFNDPVPKQFTWRDMLGYKRSVQKPGNKPARSNKKTRPNINDES
ncbi:MAG: membrane protein insertion efficiency factor YidD [Alphaproteobacteria bacterium]|nr:membrane protein insertion efficiency factor YidD [Alphaproteobacteria bacterium]